MKILETICNQGSPEWLKLRQGRLTCSKFGVLFGTSNEKNTYLRELRSGGAKSFTSAPTTWGKSYEDEARARYMIATGCQVYEAGILSRLGDSFVAGSPDGLVFETNTHCDIVRSDDGTYCKVFDAADICGGVEIKCPYDDKVHRAHMEFGLPHRYFWQVQGYIWLTGAKWWDFVSYDVRAAYDDQLFYQRIMRDDNVMKHLDLLVDEFVHVMKCNSWFATPTARSVLMSGTVAQFLNTNVKVDL